jgi:hypothetical protein
MTKLKDFAGETNEKDNLSGMLVHILADECFNMIRVVIASPYIAELIMSKLSMDIYRDILHELFTRRSHADPSGYVFELFAHKKIVQAETYNVRRIKGKPETNPLTQLCLPKRPFKIFQTIPDKIEPNLYYIPLLSSFQAVDSFEYPNRFFNVTTNYGHNINIGEDFAKIVNLMLTHDNVKRIDFFFFVPPKIFSLNEKFTCDITFGIDKKNINNVEQRRVELEKFKNQFSRIVDIYLVECDLEAYLIHGDWRKYQNKNDTSLSSSPPPSSSSFS